MKLTNYNACNLIGLNRISNDEIVPSLCKEIEI